MISTLALILLSISSANISDATVTALSEAGYDTDHIRNIEDLSRYTSVSTPSALIFDGAGFPDTNVQALIHFCSINQIPTLAIVSLADLGVDRPTKHADDFVSHDAHPKELIERIERLLGRDYLAEMPGNSTKPSIHIDRDRFEVKVDNRRIMLTFMEYQLLNVLASEAGKVFTRKELLSSVWGYAYFGGTRTVDVHIRRLRSKLNDIDHSIIETVRNVGYRFVD